MLKGVNHEQNASHADRRGRGARHVARLGRRSGIQDRHRRDRCRRFGYGRRLGRRRKGLQRDHARKGRHAGRHGPVLRRHLCRRKQDAARLELRPHEGRSLPENHELRSLARQRQDGACLRQQVGRHDRLDDEERREVRKALLELSERPLHLAHLRRPRCGLDQSLPEEVQGKGTEASPQHLG